MSPQNTKQGQIVLEGRDADFRAGFDHPVDIVDVAIALGTLAEHDGPAFFMVDVARCEKREGNHVERNAVGFAQLARPCNFLNRPMTARTRIWRIAANVLDAMPLEELQHYRSCRPALTTHVHLNGTPRTGARGGSFASRQICRPTSGG